MHVLSLWCHLCVLVCIDVLLNKGHMDGGGLHIVILNISQSVYVYMWVRVRCERAAPFSGLPPVFLRAIHWHFIVPCVWAVSPRWAYRPILYDWYRPQCCGWVKVRATDTSWVPLPLAIHTPIASYNYRQYVGVRVTATWAPLWWYSRALSSLYLPVYLCDFVRNWKSPLSDNSLIALIRLLMCIGVLVSQLNLVFLTYRGLIRNLFNAPALNKALILKSRIRLWEVAN